MTMLAHSLKNILELVPEALPFVKQASIEKEMPLDNKDSVLATALEMKYHEKIAHTSIDVFAMEKVARAVDMYGLNDTLSELTGAMVKAAAERKLQSDLGTIEGYFLKVAAFEGDHDSLEISERSTVAKDLYKEAKERNVSPSELVTLYSGNAYLSKEAAVKSLSVRFNTTKNPDFVKIARAVVDTPDIKFNADLITELADTITGMDKAAGLNFAGHNFYKEAFFIKEAAYKSSMNVMVSGKQVPYESIERVGREKIAAYMGADIAQEMDGGPQNFKAVVETLPMDMQNVLSSLIKNV